MIKNDSKKYDDLCMVSNQVLLEKKKIKFFYREESLGDLGIEMFDSGWRIISGEESQSFLDNDENLEFVALHEVLKIDESIESFLEQPVGSTFEWNDEMNSFEKEKT